MAEYSLTTPTAVAVGASVPFNNTIVDGNCCIRHRSGSGTVTLKGGTCSNPKRFKITFQANVTGVAGSIQLALYLNGDKLPETLMSVVPVATSDVWTVNTETEIYTEGCCDNISCQVVTGASVTVNTASIIVEKETTA